MPVTAAAAEVLEELAETRGQYYNLHPDAGKVLALLAHLRRPRRIVEVGTANGYSAILLGEVVRPHGGEVTTIERDGALVVEARRNIARAGLADAVTVVPGSAYKVLRDLQGPWDFAFLDGTKVEYVGYLERLLPKLSAGALLVADNLLSHPEELTAFSARVAAESQLDAVVLPVGLGLLVALVGEGRAARAPVPVTTAARLRAQP